jgi:hypothetical protein
MSHALALLTWDPGIRNILALSVGIMILIGSVILLISTNTGPRTGILIGLSVLFGWLTILGMVWWLYSGSPASLGGMKGNPSHWRVLNVNIGDLSQDPVKEVQDLPAANQQQVVDEILAAHPELEKKVNPDGTPGKIVTIGDLVDADPALLAEFKLTPNDLNGWNLLPTSNAQLGDASAIADTALVPATGQKIFSDSASYKVLGAYDIGGKENEFKLPANATMWNRVWQNIETAVHFTNPQHFIVVQVQAVVPQETPPGGKPPTPKLDTTQPVISVVMIRSLGDVRFPGFMTFLCCGIIFAILCNTLHRRDKRAARNRAAAAP